jgi:hypothetical protein
VTTAPESSDAACQKERIGHVCALRPSLFRLQPTLCSSDEEKLPSLGRGNNCINYFDLIAAFATMRNEA